MEKPLHLDAARGQAENPPYAPAKRVVRFEAESHRDLIQAQPGLFAKCSDVEGEKPTREPTRWGEPRVPVIVVVNDAQWGEFWARAFLMTVRETNEEGRRWTVVDGREWFSEN